VFRAKALLLSLTLLLALVPVVVHADATDDAVRRVASQLMCPVCEGQSVQDSASGLAKDMRTLIRQRVDAGESDQQILNEFVASYGDGILTEPPKRGISLGVWFGPIVGLVLGAALLAGVLTAWRRRGDQTPQPSPATATATALDPAVADELSRFRQELGS
jgi:cytochrome c-type biogenesis protein CcmH